MVEKTPTVAQLGREVARVVRRGLGRSVAIMGLVLVATVALLLLAISAADDLIWAQREKIVVDGATTAAGLNRVLVQISVPVIAISLLILAAALGAMAKLSEDLLAGGAGQFTTAVQRGLRRAPASLGAGLLAATGIIAAALATPLLMAAAVIGLLGAPLVSRLRRRRPELRWPSWRTLLLFAVPFGLAVVLAVRWALVLPAATLERNGPRRALGRSGELVAGRRRWVALAVLSGLVVYWGLQFALSALGRATDSVELFAMARIVAQVLTLSIPVAMVVIVFRTLVPESSPSLTIVDPARRRPPWLTATVVALALGLGGSIPLVLNPVRVEAAPAGPNAAPTRSFVVDEGFTDQGDAAPGDGICDTGESMCTLRAAIDEANANPAETSSISWAADTTSTFAETLEVTAPVILDGSGHRVVLSGRACGDCGPATKILRFSNPASSFVVRSLTLTDGYTTGLGGGAIESVATGTIDGATIVGATSTSEPGGAVAVLGGRVSMINTTIDGSSAPSAGDLFVADGASAAIAFSTFRGASGGSIVQASSGSARTDHSIIAPGAGPACTAVTQGATNLDADGTCPGSSIVGPLGPLGDNGGDVATISIDVDSGAVDPAGRSEDCPFTDARGVDRPYPDCDIGAYEYDGPVPPSELSFVIDDLGDVGDATPGDQQCATAGGACTLRAAVEEANQFPSALTTVTTALDGTIALTSSLDIAASMDISGTGHRLALDGGDAVGIISARNRASTVSLTDLSLTRGAAATGGAIASEAELNLTRVTLTQSSASAAGGALAVDAGTATLINTTFDANTATSGADVSVANGASATIVHSTLRGATGGSIANDAASGATAALRSSIVAPASGSGCTGVNAGSTNVSTDGSCPDSVSTVDGLDALADHGGSVPTISLLLTSGAIDAADGEGPCPATDARGVDRPQASACDIGSFEVEPVTSELAFTVDDLGDEGDATTGDAMCATAAGTCTLRAALDEANALTLAAPFAAPVTTVDFSVSGTVAVSSSLEISSQTTIDGAGQKILLSGGDVVGVLRASPSNHAYALANLTVANGRTDAVDGGAGLASWAPGTVTNVTFTKNRTKNVDPAAAGGGGLAVLSSNVELTNATFSDNEAGDASIGGADIYTRGQVVVQSSTFFGGNASNIAADFAGSGRVAVFDSIVAGDFFSCTGRGDQISGADNITDDGQCPGTGADPQLSPLADRGGPVPTHGLAVTSPAIDAASSARCPATDARGIVRPQGVGCDVGASEFSDAVAVTVTATPTPSALTESVRFTAVVGGAEEDVAATGTVTFFEDGTERDTVALVDGRAAIDIDTLGVGGHTILVTYSGDAVFPASFGDVEHRVLPPGTAVEVAVTPTPSVEGTEVSLTARVTAEGVSNPATGSIEFFDGDATLGSASVVNGVAELRVSSLDAGIRTIRAEYAGDALYPEASGSVEHTVLVVPTVVVTTNGSPTVFGQPLAVTATVTADPRATGEVTFFDRGVALGPVALGVGGTAVFDADLEVGIHSLSVRYPGDDRVASATSESLVQVVERADTTTALEVSADASVVGEELTFTATVAVEAPGAGNPGGSVTFSDAGSELGTATLGEDGTAVLTAPVTEVGSRTIVATYEGDGSFADSSGDVAVEARSGATTVDLVSSPMVSEFSQEVVLTATVSALAPATGTPGGTMRFFEGGLELGASALDADGVASLATSALSAGPHDIRATYEGAGSFVGSDGTTTVRVLPATTSVSVSSDINPSVTSQEVTFTATVVATRASAGIPTGTVTFSNFADPVTVPVGPDGTAQVTVDSPGGGGGVRMIATYVPTGNFSGSTGWKLQTVGAGRLTVGLSATPADPYYVDRVVLAVDLVALAPAGGNPVGTVVIADHGDPIRIVRVDGSATTTLTTPFDLDWGNHHLTATFQATSAWAAASSDPVDVSIKPEATQVDVTTSNTTPTVGESVSFEVDVTNSRGGNVTDGSVEFRDGPVLLATVPVTYLGAGYGARFRTRDLPVGTRALTIRYTGNGRWHRPSTTSVDIDVQPVPTAVIFSSGDVNVPGEPTSYEVFVRNVGPVLSTARVSPTGSVRLSVDGRVVRLAPLQAGTAGTARAVLNFGPLTAGPHQLVAEYLPTGDFAPSSATRTDDVGRLPTAVTLSSQVGPVEWGRDVAVSATVRTGVVGAFPIPGGIVEISDGQGTSCTVSAPSGTCTLRFPTPGERTLTARYLGDQEHGTASIERRLTVIRRTPVLSASIAPERPVTGDDVTVSWRLSGPASGTVGAQLSNGTTCNGGLTGSCVGRYPLQRAGQNDDAVVFFGGDALWAPVAQSVDFTLTGCFPFPVYQLDQNEGGYTASVERNCNGGSGYLEGTELVLTALPPPDTAAYRWTTQWSVGGNAQRSGKLDVAVQVGLAPGRARWATLSISKQYQCVDVVIGEELIGDASGTLQSASEPNCPIAEDGSPMNPRWQYRYRGRTGRFLAGSTLSVSPVSYGNGTELYGFTVDGRRIDGAPGEIVLTKDIDIRATFGPPCHALDLEVLGSGSASVDTAPNCSNPFKGITGYGEGSVIQVSGQAGGSAYLSGWGPFGAGDRKLVCRSCADGADRYTYTNEIPVRAGVAGRWPSTPTLPVLFAQCRRLTISPVMTEADSGVVDVNGVACPNRRDESYFADGETVQLVARSQLRWVRFGKWNLGEPDDTSAVRNLRLNRDRTVRPSFYSMYGDCSEVNVRSKPPGDALVAVEFVTDDQLCVNGSLRDGPAEQLSGRFRGGRLTFGGIVAEGEPLVGWGFVPKGNTAQRSDRFGRSGAVVTTGISGEWDATFTPCQGIEPVAVMRLPNGERQEVLDAGQEFIEYSPAPNCPYGNNAWVVGTEVRMQPKADERGYTHTGWDTPRSTADEVVVALDGAAPSTRVVIGYDVICHQLTLTHDADDVTVEPEGNCPGTDPGELTYVGGTGVILQGSVPSGKVWQGWAGDVEVLDAEIQKLPKANPVGVVLDADKTAGHRWRSKTTGEKIEDWAEEAWNDTVTVLANVGKKALGFVAVGVGTVLSGAPPLGWIMMATTAPGLLFDGMAGMTDAWNSTAVWFGDTFGFDPSAALASRSCWPNGKVTPIPEDAEFRYPDEVVDADGKVINVDENGDLVPLDKNGYIQETSCSYFGEDAQVVVDQIGQTGQLLAAPFTCGAAWAFAPTDNPSPDPLQGGGQLVGSVEGIRLAESDYRDALQAYEKSDGGAYATARLKAAKASALKKYAAAGGAAADFGMGLYDALDGGIGWDTLDSIGDDTAWWSCLDAAKPDYIPLPTFEPDAQT